VELSKYYSHVLRDSAPLILPTPSEFETRVGNWIVRNPISSGTFGHVSIVTHVHTGKAAAMKELWKTPRNAFSVQREIDMAKSLREIPHERLGAPFEIFHKIVYDKTDRARFYAQLDDTWRPSSNDAIEYYALYSPLSNGTFTSLIRSNATRFTRTRLFTQILEGLAVLHNNGIAHRDIKPGNLVVAKYDPPNAQIIDFGCATFESKILYDRPGTIPYLAPEQAAGLYHGRSVDYWSIALVGLELLGYSMPGVQVTAEIYDGMHRWLANQSDDAMVSCCKGMLQWEPASRLTAADALEGCLGQYRDVAVENGKRELQNLDRQVRRRTSADFRTEAE